jgi:hypothetical protein
VENVNKKAILATVLVVQLILLILITVSTVRSDRIQFSHQNDFRRLSAYRIADVADNIQYDLTYIKSKNSTNETMTSYLNFLYIAFPQYNFLQFQINSTYIRLADPNLELLKEVYVP